MKWMCFNDGYSISLYFILIAVTRPYLAVGSVMSSSRQSSFVGD